MIQHLRARIAWFMALLLWVLTLGRVELDWEGVRSSHSRTELHASQSIEADPVPLGRSDAGCAGPTAPPARR